MMNFELLDAEGAVLNTIIADADFMAAHYAEGSYRLAAAQPAVAPQATTWTVLAFRSRFTDDEKRSIYSARPASVDVQIWLDDLAAATDVRSDDPRIVAGLQGLEAAGLIAAGRAAEILGGSA